MPRQSLLAAALMGLLLVTGCVAGSKEPSSGVTANAVTGDAIEVTSLDPVPPRAVPEPVGDDLATPEAVTPPEAAAAPVAAAELPVPKSEAQLACEKKRGRWVVVGNSALRSCVFNTRDAGKQCSRGNQCESVCLARSGTCAPFKPLLGCNEILQDNGARVTECLE